MKPKHYILTAIISYLLFTIVTTPAASIFSLIQKDTKLPFTIQGIDGSIWNGSAERVIIPSAPQLENIYWSINPFALLIANVSASIEAEIMNNILTGDISVSNDGSYRASDISTQLSSSTVQKLINLPLGELSGEFYINIESIQSTKNIPVIDGTIAWEKAAYTLADTVNLGTINLIIKPADSNALKAKINNKGGDIAISGEIHIADNKTYKLDLAFAPLETTNNNIKQSLAMFARKQTDGSYLLRKTGNLRSLGF
ncbi:MAG: type II secretion system protein N [Gammaproteobacteria bacterium]|nr:type II secretion system protein N [Gammaproteobacteria bacterium]